MSLLIALLIGTGMGVATGLWFQRNADYILFDILSGIGGAILGLALAFFIRNGEIESLVSWSAVLLEILGAAAFLLLYQFILAIPKRKHKNIKGPAEE